MFQRKVFLLSNLLERRRRRERKRKRDRDRDLRDFVIVDFIIRFILFEKLFIKRIILQ